MYKNKKNKKSYTHICKYATKKVDQKRRTSFKSEAPLLCFHSSNECYLFLLGTIVIVCPFLQTPVGIALQLKEFFLFYFREVGKGPFLLKIRPDFDEGALGADVRSTNLGFMSSEKVKSTCSPRGTWT